jgi:hypothetical protein
MMMECFAGGVHNRLSLYEMVAANRGALIEDLFTRIAELLRV